jgi:hypothetical protein
MTVPASFAKCRIEIFMFGIAGRHSIESPPPQQELLSAASAAGHFSLF